MLLHSRWSFESLVYSLYPFYWQHLRPIKKLSVVLNFLITKSMYFECCFTQVQFYTSFLFIIFIKLKIKLLIFIFIFPLRDLAMDVLNLICDNENEKIQICIMCDLSEPEKDYLHEKVSMFSYNIFLLKITKSLLIHKKFMFINCI